MNAEDFTNWTETMLHRGKCKNMSHLAQILDINRTTLYAMMKRGGSKRDALACAAILIGLEPYGETK